MNDSSQVTLHLDLRPVVLYGAAQRNLSRFVEALKSQYNHHTQPKMWTLLGAIGSRIKVGEIDYRHS